MMRHRLPAGLSNANVMTVEGTAPFKVRVTHHDRTSAVHVFRHSDFGTGTFAALGTAAGFATAQVVEPPNLGWDLGGGLIYDQCSDGLWAHARGWCPDGSHGLSVEVER